MKQIRLWFSALMAGMLLLGSLMACTQPASRPASEDQFLRKHGEMKVYIGKARTAVVNLESFSWGELSDIGIESPPSGLCVLGACVITKGKAVNDDTNMWTPLVDMMPRAESAKPLKIYCDKCLEMAVKIRTQRPNTDNVTPAAAAENPEVAQWQEQCHQLESTLMGAETLALKYVHTAEETFKELNESFEKSDDKVRRQYQPKLQSKSNEYKDLLDEVIRNLQYARSNLAQIAGWEDYAVGIGADQSV
ncbi:MAG: J domain-containing protein, partial [Chloroflexi bacterium]|nr:J domain-containing protein [Chloroflexota bacterium]